MIMVKSEDSYENPAYNHIFTCLPSWFIFLYESSSGCIVGFWW